MKTMKRIAVLILCLMLVCSLAACTEEYDDTHLVASINELEKRTKELEQELHQVQTRLEELSQTPEGTGPIQSLVWYNTGFGESVELDPVNYGTQMQFLVSPSGKAKEIKKAWLADKSAVKVTVSYLSPEDGKLSGTATLAVEEVTEADGILTLKVKEDANAPLTAEFKSGDAIGLLYVTLSFDDTNMTTDMIPVYVLLG